MSAELIQVLAAVGDPGARDTLNDALRHDEGFLLEEVGSESAALEALEAAQPDVILFDLALPDSHGLQTVALLQAQAPDQPLLLLADPQHEALALRAGRHGATDYLLKSQLFPLVLRRAVRHAVETARAERRQQAAERALAESERRYRSLFEQSREAIYMTARDGRILEVNQATLDLAGYPEDELVGLDVLQIYAHPEDRERFQQQIETRGHVRDFEVCLRRGDGELRWCLISAWLHRDADGSISGYQGIIHDITDRKEVEEQLSHEAFHDHLTGLPNRALFMDRLERAVARRRRGEERDLAVLFLDLDRFKVANDSLGHLAGDELLRRVATLLQAEVREEDTVARIGGDEFAILLDDLEEAADATHVAERIQERLRAPFRIRGHDIFTSVSIGITFGGRDAPSPEELLRDADTAMYRAKELGPARYQIFDPGMHAHAVTLLQLETDLRLALERREFVVHYQPVLELDRDRLIGFEALARWNHPQRGLLQPQSFIPIAEETGLIVPLGAWVLQEALEQLRSWRDGDPDRRDLFVAVNLSARQFSQPDLLTTVSDALTRVGLPGSALRLEVTESTVMQDPEAAIAALRQLRDLGIGLAIDDFGTGYSSLNYLHDFPVDTLKIDRSFIRRLEEAHEADLVETILTLARKLGMTAVAEGVETERQLALLRTLGPASVQGFLFSSPLARDEAGRLLNDYRPLTDGAP